MPYHVPFNQRDQKTTGNQPPVYIGFEATPHHQHYANQRHYANQPHYYSGQPVYRAPGHRFNWPAFTGFFLALASPFTAFLLAPIALMFSLRGLHRAPRKLAFVGTLFSLAGTAILATLIFALAAEHTEHRTRHVRAHQHRVLSTQRASTSASIDAAAIQLEKYRELHEGQLPGGVEGNTMTIKFVDAWQQELRYEPGDKQAIIRSAGPDKKFDTRDDLVGAVKGEPLSIFVSTPNSSSTD